MAMAYGVNLYVAAIHFTLEKQVRSFEIQYNQRVSETKRENYFPKSEIC